MTKISTAAGLAAAILALAVIPADAAKNDRNAAIAQREASCKAQAAKKFSAIRFLARKDFVDKCMGRDAMAKKKAKPAKQRAAQR